MTTLVLLLIMIGFAAWVLAPHWKKKGAYHYIHFFETPIVLQQLKESKSLLLQSLRELDLDYETGKLSVEDYKELTQKTRAQTAEVLLEIDQEEEKWKIFKQQWEKHVHE
ncbi:MAG: hypothetical protein R3A11_07080 [Bdellovibrionota bacterium]